MIRRGFTLMEIMVSLLIFSVVSLALIGVLSAAVKLFRAGEAGRAASDETIATLAQLDDDLKRMVPAADNGFLFTKIKNTNGFAAGNMVLAFKIRNPDGSTISDTGMGARLIVVWWVDDLGHLCRKSDKAADSGGSQPTEFDVAASIYGSTPQPVANGCLYFGVDLSTDALSRTTLDWEPHYPAVGAPPFSTEPLTAGATPDPFPTAIRITTVLTGGSRNFIRGRCVKDDSTGIRVTGVGQVPVGAGVMARLGDPGAQTEWVTYSTFKGGVLNCTTTDRAQRRTAQFDATGKEVTFAPSYTLVRTLPR